RTRDGHVPLRRCPRTMIGYWLKEPNISTAMHGNSSDSRMLMSWCDGRLLRNLIVFGPPPIHASSNPLTPDPISSFDHFRSNFGGFAVRHCIECGVDLPLSFGTWVERRYSSLN